MRKEDLRLTRDNLNAWGQWALATARTAVGKSEGRGNAHASRHGKPLDVYVGIELNSPVGKLQRLITLAEQQILEVMAEFRSGANWFDHDQAMKPVTVIELFTAEMVEAKPEASNIARIMYEEAVRYVDELIVNTNNMIVTAPKLVPMTSDEMASLLDMVTSPLEFDVDIDASEFVRAEQAQATRVRENNGGGRPAVQIVVEDYFGMNLEGLWARGLRRDFYTAPREYIVSFLASEAVRRFQFALWQQTSIEEDVAGSITEMYQKAASTDNLKRLQKEQPHLYAFITAFMHNPLLRQGDIDSTSPQNMAVARFMRLAGQIVGYKLIRSQVNFNMLPQPVLDYALDKGKKVTVTEDQKASFALLRLYRKFLKNGQLDVETLAERNADIAAEIDANRVELSNYLIKKFSKTAQKIANWVIKTANSRKLDINELIEMVRAGDQSDEQYNQQIVEFLKLLENVINTGQGEVKWPFEYIAPVEVDTTAAEQNLTDDEDDDLEDAMRRLQGPARVAAVGQ